MKKYKKLNLCILCTTVLITSFSAFRDENIVNAQRKRVPKNTTSSKTVNNTFEFTIDLSKLNIVNEKENLEILLKNNKISKEEYAILKDILYQTDTSIKTRSYYPERKAGYINNWGVNKIYNSINWAAGISAISSSALSTLAGIATKSSIYGWGLNIIGWIASFSPKSELARAIEQVYWQGKGIDVYYSIHSGVMSLNKVRFVVI